MAHKEPSAVGKRGWTVYARSTTVHARPESIDAGLAHLRDEVMPTILDIDGCVGLSMLVDRRSCRCIATSAWQSIDAMRASEGRLGPIRGRFAEILGGQPMVEPWEIAVLHRDHTSRPGACVRATWLRVPLDQLDHAIDLYRMVSMPAMEDLEGFCSTSLMVNRESGLSVSSASFDSREAMQRSREQATSGRESAAREVNATLVDMCEFELAFAHLRVPELA